MWETILKDFVYLWAVIDPIGSIPVFIAVTAGTSKAVQRQIAYRAIITAGLVLILFIVGGQVFIGWAGDPSVCLSNCRRPGAVSVCINHDFLV